MINALGRMADRVLVRLAPGIDASAGCYYYWVRCFCWEGRCYSKRCMTGCTGVPNHCYQCTWTGAC